MKRAFASIMVSAALVISLRTAYACNQCGVLNLNRP